MLLEYCQGRISEIFVGTVGVGTSPTTGINGFVLALNLLEWVISPTIGGFPFFHALLEWVISPTTDIWIYLLE